MFTIVCDEGEEEPPEQKLPPLLVQVMSAERLISVFFPDMEDPVVRWSSNPFYCVWKGSVLGHRLEVSVVEGWWYHEIVRHYLFIHCDDKLLWWISIPSVHTNDLNLNGAPLDARREPVYGTLLA